MSTIAVELTDAEARDSWVPMIAIALGQMIMSFNVASLPVALGGMVESFGVPPTTVATGIVAYSMLVAGFVMLGAKLVQRYGAARVFRAAVIVFCASQVLMTFSPTAVAMISAQALCGAAGAVIVPALVALIAENYRGRQQATAIGALGSARAAAGVLAFVVGGILGTYIGWRPAFGILIAVSAIVFLLSFRLKSIPGSADVSIDLVGVVLAAGSIILISFGFNNLNGWGLMLAGPNAPFNLLGLSPAPILIVLGIGLGQAFLSWTHRRASGGKTPLLAIEVIDSPQERAAVYAMFAVVALEAALNFTVPLYIQIVQGRSPLATAVAMMPFNLTVFFAAMLIVRVYDRLTPRQIGRYGFILLHGGAAVAGLRRAQRLERDSRPRRADPVRHRPRRAGHAAVQRAGHGLAEGACRRRRFLARHDQQSRGGRRHRSRGRTPRRPAERSRDEPYRGQSPAAQGDPVAGRPGQHHLRQQRPAGNHLGRHRRGARTGGGGHARQHRGTAARAEDRTPDHGGLFLAIVPAGRLPDYKPGQIPAGGQDPGKK